jgi:hypothetical protein
MDVVLGKKDSFTATLTSSINLPTTYSYHLWNRGTADVAFVLEHEGQYHYSPLHEMLHSIKVR